MGGFGSLNLGVGLLPGLEAFGRLAFEGDLQCNQYAGFLREAGCQSRMRDLSLSAKYTLPLNLPLNTSLAVGFTDYGGAATNFRGTYAVATSEQGPLDLTIGLGRAGSKPALLEGAFGNAVLLQGAFGSAVLRLTERAQVQLERSAGGAFASATTRLGASYQIPMGEGADVLLAASTQLGQAAQEINGARVLNRSQASVALRLHLDRARQHSLRRGPTPLEPNLGEKSLPTPWPTSSPAISNLTSPQNQSGAKRVEQLEGPAKGQPEAGVTDGATQLVEDVLAALTQEGFTRVSVSASQSGSPGAPPSFTVQAEPSAYRQSSLFATGRAVRAWLQALQGQKTLSTNGNATLALTLTYLGRPVLLARTSESCAKLFRAGHDQCARGVAVELLAPQQEIQSALGAHLSGPHGWAAPQIELGVGLRTTVGTEYGLADYAAAAELGAELSLAHIAPGLGAQLLWSAPVSSSGDFRAGGVFYTNSFVGPRVEQAMLSYWRPLGLVASGQVSAQLSAGAVMHGHSGAQVDAYWLRDRLRVHSTVGHYTSADFLGPRSPALTAVRYSLEPAKWHVEAAVGRFYNMDRGWRVSTTHWFGDTSFTAYVRQSGYEGLTMPVRRFAGFEVSMPLGPERAQDVAGLSVRGRDRWRTGLETKVGERDNYITRGYGMLPGPRHGLADITDHDRSGLPDLWAARGTMRHAMQ
jgi:hypothetical protein